MSASIALFAAVAAPWLAACASALTGAIRGRVPRASGVLSLLAPLPALAVALWVPTGSVVSLDFMLLDADLRMGPLTRTFLLGAGVLWFASALFTVGRGAPAHRDFHLFFQLAMAGNIGAVLAGDVVTFYVHFVTVSVAAWGLVIQARTPEAIRAGRVYIGFVLLGEALILPGLWLVTGGFDTIAWEQVQLRAGGGEHALVPWLLLAGFGVKLGMLPFHAWLPLAHPVAPVPASAVLSGAMIKVGVLGWLQILPGGALGYAGAYVVITLGLIAALGAAVIGLTQTRAKTLLGYSSVSQMGLVTCAFGVLMAAPLDDIARISAAVAFIAFHHGFAKAALFLSCGLGNRRLALALALFPAITLAGLPLTSGGAVKSILGDLAATLPGVAAAAPVALAVSALLTSLLMLRFLLLLRGLREGPDHPAGVVAMGLPVLGSILLSFTALSLAHIKLDAATWAPFLGAAVLALVVTRYGGLGGLGRLEVPEGDIVLWLGAVWRRFVAATVAWADRIGAAYAWVIDAIVRCRFFTHDARGSLTRLEARMMRSRWIAVMLFVIILVVVMTAGCAMARH